jgi:sterol 3beta-glucosyltransferase
LILPLKDIENVDKEKGFRFGYHGLVITIRGHEEIFFEFNKHELRDDCAITLLRRMESLRFMEDSNVINKQDVLREELAKAEHDMLQEARHDATPEPVPETLSNDFGMPLVFVSIWRVLTTI